MYETFRLVYEREPALVRSVFVAALVAGAGAVGLAVDVVQVEALAGAALTALVTGGAIRPKVFSPATVEALAEEPSSKCAHVEHHEDPEGTT